LQLVLRGTADAPLIIAAMTEEQFVAKLKSRAGMYFGCATAVAVIGLVRRTDERLLVKRLDHPRSTKGVEYE
jgi:hypothetical protein